MIYSEKKKLIKQFNYKIDCLFKYYLFDEVNDDIDLSPKIIYWVLKRHFKLNKVSFKRKELKDFSALIFFQLQNKNNLSRKQIEFFFKVINEFSFILRLLSLVIISTKRLIVLFFNWIKKILIKYALSINDNNTMLFPAKINILNNSFLI